MKKLIFAICFSFLSVMGAFAQEVVAGVDDPYSVKASYLVVNGFTEKQVLDVVHALFKYADNRYDEERGVFTLSAMDFYYICSVVGFSVDESADYALGVLKNAVAAKTAVHAKIRINPEYETIDLTKYESRYPKENIGWRGNEFRQEYSFLIKEKYCQHGDLIIDKGVFCGKVNLLDHVDEHGKQELSLLLYGSPALIGHVEQDGTVYEVYAWR